MQKTCQMKSRIQLKEAPEDSCKAISYYIGQLEHDHQKCAEIKDILLKDLCWKIKPLDPLNKATILANAWYQALPAILRSDYPPEAMGFSQFETLMKQKRESKDIAIITVIGKELEAVLLVFGRMPSEPPDQRSGEFAYWFGEIKRHKDRPLSVVITMVAEPLNVPCAIAVEHLLGDFNIGILTLVGIAAGVKDRVKLGDVVFADKVYDYENVRLEVNSRFFGLLNIFKKRPRPKNFNITKEVKVAYHRYDDKLMKTFFRNLMGTVSCENISKEIQTNIPSFHKGTIAAGEKLIADGSLKKMYKIVDQEIRAGAMEDSGFAQVAEIKKIPWCIFRGIVDYGDGCKSNDWHLASALAAASAAFIFMQSVWKDGE